MSRIPVRRSLLIGIVLRDEGRDVVDVAGLRYCSLCILNDYSGPAGSILSEFHASLLLTALEKATSIEMEGNYRP